MAKYTVKMSCGHEEMVELLGKNADRQGLIENLKIALHRAFFCCSNFLFEYVYFSEKILLDSKEKTL